MIGLFFEDEDEEIQAEAKAICRTCPVKQECLDAALSRREKGIWGGTTEDERKQIRRQQR